MRTRLVLAVLPIALIGVTAATSSAAPKPPIKKTFTAAATPDPTATATSACHGLTPSSRFTVPFKVPAAGKLVVDLTGFQGDWDLIVENKGGTTLGESAGFVEATKESVALKFKKPTDVVIVACNFAGGPAASGAYTFTFA